MPIRLYRCIVFVACPLTACYAVSRHAGSVTFERAFSRNNVFVVRDAGRRSQEWIELYSTNMRMSLECPATFGCLSTQTRSAGFLGLTKRCVLAVFIFIEKRKTAVNINQNLSLKNFVFMPYYIYVPVSFAFVFILMRIL